MSFMRKIFLAVVMMLISVTAGFAYCLGSDPAQNFERADAVFLGQAVRGNDPYGEKEPALCRARIRRQRHLRQAGAEERMGDVIHRGKCVGGGGGHQGRGRPLHFGECSSRMR